MIQGFVEGLEALLRKTQPKILQGPMHRFLDRSRFLVEREGKRHSPVDSGRLRQSIRSERDPRPLPLYARVGTDVTAGGFPYGLALDEGGEQVFYTYRGTPFRGQATEGWFTERGYEAQRPRILSFASGVPREIFEEWSRG